MNHRRKNKKKHPNAHSGTRFPRGGTPHTNIPSVDDNTTVVTFLGGAFDSHPENDGEDSAELCETLDLTLTEDINEILKDVPANTPVADLHPAMQHVHMVLNARCGLEFAIKIVLKETTHEGVWPALYEAGVLYCMCAIMEYAKQRGSLPEVMAHFDRLRAALLLGFSHRLRAFMRAASSRSNEVPSELSIEWMPDDAAPLWNLNPDRVVAAVSAIDLSCTVGEQDPHCLSMASLFQCNVGAARLRITQIKEVQTTLPLACGVCFEPAHPSDECGHSACKYVICTTCRTREPGLSVCPFCRASWTV